MMHERIEKKTREQIGYMRRAGRVVADIHAALRGAAHAGVETQELDAIAARVIADHGAKSNFLGYQGFPANVCISINDTVVHGIPDSTQLKDGDLVSFDCGAYVEVDGQQWHGDAAFSMIVGGDQAGSERRVDLNDITRDSLWAAIAAVSRGGRVKNIGAAVEKVVWNAPIDLGWQPGIIEEYVGHGIGTAMHQAPDVPNFVARGHSPRLRPGMVLAIEPMLVTDDIETVTLEDGWTVKTVDGGDAAHWEHTVAILDEGISVLTSPDCGAAGLAKYDVVPVNLD